MYSKRDIVEIADEVIDRLNYIIEDIENIPYFKNFAYELEYMKDDLKSDTQTYRDEIDKQDMEELEDEKRCLNFHDF